MQAADGHVARGHRRAHAVGVGAVLAVLAWAQYRIRVDPHAPLPTAVLLVAALIAAIAVAGQGEGSTRLPTMPERGPHRGRQLVALGFAGIAAGSTILTLKWHGLFITGSAVFLLGVAILSIAVSRFDGPTDDPAASWTAAEAAAMLGIVGVALALRFYRFTEFPDPYGICAIEEAQTGMGGYFILHGARPWEFMLDHYLAALALRLGGPTLPALRVPFAIFSALTVLPMYLLLRQLVRRSAALFGTFLLAASSWHLMYARCAHNIFFTTFLVVLLLALLVHAERTHRLALFPWIGLLGGYTLYAYAGYRGTVGFILMFVGLGVMRHRRAGARAAEPGVHRGLLRRDLAGLGLAAVVVVAVIPPLLVRLSRDPWHASYFEAAQRSMANREYYAADLRVFVQQRIIRAHDAAAMFLHSGDISPAFNYPRAPMLDPLTGTLFVAGFMYAVCFPRRGHNAFFVAMFVVLFSVGSIFVQNLDIRRLQGLIPLVLVFAALFVDRLLACTERLGKPGLRILSGAAVLAVLFVSGWSYNLFFNKMATNRRVLAAFHNQYTELIRLGREPARGRYLLTISDLRNFFEPNDYSWLITDRIRGQQVSDLAMILPPEGLPQITPPMSVVILPPYEGAAIAELLRAVYPGTACRTVLNRRMPSLKISVCDLPAGAAPRDSAVGTLTAQYFLHPPPTEPPFLERREPFIAYALVPPECRHSAPPGIPDECYAEWSGTFALPADVSVSVTPRARAGTVHVFIDGEPAGTDMHLARGVHTFGATARFPRALQTGVQVSWTLPGSPRTLMPFYAAAPAQVSLGGVALPGPADGLGR